MCNKLELNLNVCFNYGADGGEKLASHIPKQPLKVENHWISLEICQSIVVMHTQTSEWLLCLLLHCSVVGNKILITIDYFLFLVIITNKLSKEGVVLPQKKKLCTYFFLRNKIITLRVHWQTPQYIAWDISHSCYLKGTDVACIPLKFIFDTLVWPTKD